MGDANQRAEIRAYIERDAFANHLGAKIEALTAGHARVSLRVTEAMINFHGTTHGGIIFALADFALAAASNSRGQTAFALTINVAFLATTRAGDRLVAEAYEQHASGPTALYDLTVRREGSDEPIARAQAMTYRKKEWFVRP
jgi:acyl-CoA thioesterase